MSLYSQWNDITNMKRTPEETQVFWDEYFAIETEAYKKILARKDNFYDDKLNALAAEFEMEPVVFAGFMDGINTSLDKEYDLDKLKEGTSVLLKFDFERLYYNMLEAKAKWLYTLDEWDDVLAVEKRNEIGKKWRLDKQAVSTKIGRNSLCPCGSGKKYKKCCGTGK